ncbi:MAG: CotH kinase family protein [Fibrobacterota bacterium]|nr:CotH kinase family protein [Fibrobacterota bacterium]QQS04820.1 MAG: CotH kinase family protein [Fibrobacterota bacterium]
MFQLAFVLVAAVHAKTDSTDIVFSDASVRSYAISFYAPDWKARMEANWVVDSGYVPARFSDGTVTLDSVGVRYKGNSSYTLAGNNPKKPLKIKFNEFKDTSYFGIKVLNFSNGIGDPTLMREHISYAIARKYLPAPRSNFVHIAIEGQAVGLYTQVEQADKTFLKRWFPDSSKGNLFKAGDDGATLGWIDANASSYATSGDYELKTNEDAANWRGFVGFVDFLNRSTDEEFCAGRSAYVDDDNLGKFLAFNTVLSNFDSYNGSGRNWYMYQQDTTTTAMRMIPWDLNLSFGAYGGASSALGIAIDTVQAPLADRPLFKRALACPATRNAYFRWMRDMVTSQASTDSVEAAMVRDSALIAAFVAADSNKFYTAAAWKTNLRANFRASEGLIPGLVSFSKSRNTSISTALESFIDVAIRKVDRSWGLVRSGDDWRLRGLEAIGAGTVSWTSIDGRRSGSMVFQPGDNDFTIPLPHGLVAVSVRSARGSHTVMIHNTRK